jgi:hypothetical protein
MTLIEAKGTKAGQLESIGQPVVKVAVNAVNNQAFVAGDVLCYQKSGGDANKWKKCTSGDVRPFAVAYKDKASTATRFAYVDDAGVYVTVIADGAIKADAYVKPATATDGQVISASETSTATGITGSLGIIGKFIKVAKWVPEGDGYNSRTDAADGDIILIKLME